MHCVTNTKYTPSYIRHNSTDTLVARVSYAPIVPFLWLCTNPTDSYENPSSEFPDFYGAVKEIFSTGTAGIFA
eukprot:scaffold5097_cov52-Attheya_sp.AAC.14